MAIPTKELPSIPEETAFDGKKQSLDNRLALLGSLLGPNKKPLPESPSTIERSTDKVSLPRLNYTPTLRQAALVSTILIVVAGTFGLSRLNFNLNVHAAPSQEIAIQTELQELCEESKGPGNISPHDGESPRTPKGHASLEAPYAYGGMSMSVPHAITQKLGLPGDMVLTCEDWTVKNAEPINPVLKPPQFPRGAAWGSGGIGHFQVSISER